MLRTRPRCHETRFSSVRAALAVLLCPALVISAATANDIYYVGHQYTASSDYPGQGSFFHGDLWLNYLVPDEHDAAIFGSGKKPGNDNLGGDPHYLYFGNYGFGAMFVNPYPIEGGDAAVASLVIQSGTWTFDFGSGSSPHYFGPIDPLTGSLSVAGALGITSSSSSPQLTLTNGTLSAGNVLVSAQGMDWLGNKYTSRAIVDDAELRTSTLFDVGVLGGRGSISVVNGGKVFADYTRIGENDGSEGSFTISGPGSSLFSTHGMQVSAGKASGTLVIENGGLAEVERVALADYGLGEGTALVSGPGSSFKINKDALVGDTGKGIFNVRRGGRVESAGAVIGVQRGSSGFATVQDADSTWTMEAGLTIGELGEGSLKIADSGSVSAASASIGLGNKGTVSVLSGGKLNLKDDVAVGDGSIFVHGELAKSLGTLTVEGAGSECNGSGLSVGRQSSQGIVWIEDGGAVNVSGACDLGDDESAEGTMTVTGVGSRYQGSDMTVGAFGKGSLFVEEGGIVNVESATTIGAGWSSIGFAAIRDSGSQLSTDYLTVGSGGIPGGTATLQVSQNGLVTAKTLDLGSMGLVEVRDGGSIVVGEGQPTAGTIVVGQGGLLCGDGKIEGNVMMTSGIFSPGHSPGALTIDGDLSTADDGVLRMEIGGKQDSYRDRIVINGAAALRGRLDLVFVDGFAPKAGDTMSLVDASNGLVEDFTRTNILGLASGFQYTMDFRDNSFVLTALNDGISLVAPGDADQNGAVDIFDVALVQTYYGTTEGAMWSDGDFDRNGSVDIFDVAILQVNYGCSRGEPGDLDRNGNVDIFDVAVLQTKYGMTSGGTWADGDFDGNGTVDIFDVAMMQVNYGHGVASAPAPVPEPATLVLAGIGLACLASCGQCLRRRRQRGWSRRSRGA
jgi:T5SS/PEP-CTERM-associated repeat protein